MKRTVAILMALILLIGLAVPLSAADMGKLVLGNEIFLKAGDTKTIPVSIENAGELSVIQFVVEYDSTKLELQNVKPTVIAGKEVNIVTGAEKGTILDGVDSDVKVAKAQISQPELGKVSILWESENTIECDGVLAYLTFEALEDGIGKAGVVVSDEEEFIFKVDSQDEGSSSDIIKDVVEEPMVEEKYTVSFNAGKGTGAPAEVKSVLGQVEIPDVTPVYEGHTFLGWATYSNATEAEYERGKTYEVNQDLDLFAVWVKTPKIVVGEVKGRAGEEVSVTIDLKNNPGIASMKLNIEYDDNVLEIISATIHPDFKNVSGAIAVENISKKPILLNWSNLNISGGNIAGTSFATLVFRIKDNAEVGKSAINVTYNEKDVFSSSEEGMKPIKFIVENGSVEIVEYIPGDINGDGDKNNMDVMTLFYYLSGLDYYVVEAALDVNGDGELNNMDVMTLFYHLSGLDYEIY